MASNTVLLVASEAKIALSPDKSLEDNLLAAMKSARNNWMAPSDDDALNGAVAGTMMFYGEGTPEYERLSRDFKMLKKVNAALHAAMSGVPVDFSDLIDQEEQDNANEPIKFMNLWRKAEAEEPRY